MECFHPISIRSPDGNYHKVSCGQCFACQSNRRNEFAFRLKEEMKHSVCSFTLTLTYDDQHLPPLESFSNDPVKAYLTINEVCDLHSFYYHPYDIRHIQLFHKSLRKKYQFRFFGVAEYGSHSNRPHYHIIYFFRTGVDRTDFLSSVASLWKYGRRITLDTTDDSCIQYTLKYCLKPRWIRQPKPKIFCSKKPFIGEGFLTLSMLTYLQNQRTGDFIKYDSYEKRLPRIYRDCLFGEPDSSMRDENSTYVKLKVFEQSLKYEHEADDKGISVQDLKRQREEVFINKIINSIKKKQL